MTTALVTGASGGIGSAIARRLASDGHEVIVGYHRAEEKARALVASFDGEGHRVLQISVGEAASLESAAAHVAETSGGLDVLVNCAGITRPVPHDDLDGLDDELIDYLVEHSPRLIETCRGIRERMKAGRFHSHDDVKKALGLA